jgi:hypothetical protein
MSKMDSDAVERWSRWVRWSAGVFACLWPLAACLLLVNDPSVNALALGAMGVGCSGIGAFCMLPPERGLGWAGAPRVFVTAWVLAWTATFVWWWLGVPLVVSQPSVVFPTGAAVGRFLAIVTLAVTVGALVLGVVGAALLSWVYRYLATTRISRALRALTSSVAAALVCAGALAAVLATELDASKSVPLDHYLQALPVVQILENSRCAAFTHTDADPRLSSERCPAPQDHCQVGNNRQRSDVLCEALVLQRDQVAGAVLVSARTKTGLDPIVWCRTGGLLDCAETVFPVEVRTSVTVPRAWQVAAWLGLGLALSCVAAGWRVLRTKTVSTPEGGATQLDFAHRVSIVVLVVVAGTATPLVVSMLLGFR